jgi:hypothetical protein
MPVKKRTMSNIVGVLQGAGSVLGINGKRGDQGKNAIGLFRFAQGVLVDPE